MLSKALAMQMMQQIGVKSGQNNDQEEKGGKEVEKQDHVSDGQLISAYIKNKHLQRGNTIDDLMEQIKYTFASYGCNAETITALSKQSTLEESLGASIKYNNMAETATTCLKDLNCNRRDSNCIQTPLNKRNQKAQTKLTERVLKNQDTTDEIDESASKVVTGQNMDHRKSFSLQIDNQADAAKETIECSAEEVESVDCKCNENHFSNILEQEKENKLDRDGYCEQEAWHCDKAQSCKQRRYTLDIIEFSNKKQIDLIGENEISKGVQCNQKKQSDYKITSIAKSDLQNSSRRNSFNKSTSQKSLVNNKGTHKTKDNVSEGNSTMKKK